MTNGQVDGDGWHMTDALEVVHSVVIGNVCLATKDIDDGAVDLLQFGFWHTGHSWHTALTATTILRLLEQSAVADHNRGDTRIEAVEEGLQAYYKGDWKSARSFIKNSNLEVGQVFLERMGSKAAPEGWSGIWTMTTK